MTYKTNTQRDREQRARLAALRTQAQIEEARRHIALAETVDDPTVRGMILHTARGKLATAHEAAGQPIPQSLRLSLQRGTRKEFFTAPIHGVRVRGGGVR